MSSERTVSRRAFVGGVAGIAIATELVGEAAMAQTVEPALEPGEQPGERPYEMVWANRVEPAPPTLRFDDLRGWTVRVEGGAQAGLRASRAQDVWGRPVARLRYRGDGKAGSPARILVAPPAPVAVPPGADCVQMWAYGNRWDWANPPDTPPVAIRLHLRDAGGQPHVVHVDTFRWEEWWLLHRRLPAGLRAPVVLEALEFGGGWQPEWRRVYLDSVRFFREEKRPLAALPRPRRNVALPPGQSPGANTGPGRLPFPTRERTILPMLFARAGRSAVTRAGAAWRFEYAGPDGRVAYTWEPARGLEGIVAWVDGRRFGALAMGAGVRLEGATAPAALTSSRRERDTVVAAYSDGTELRLRIWNKSLVVDVANRTGRATELALGEITGLDWPRVIYNPFLTYGASHPTVALARSGGKRAFAAVMTDWYRSNGTEPYGGEQAGETTAKVYGGVRYLPRTDGKRNPLFERVFFTVSTVFEEVLPTVDNPVGLHARQATDRLWQQTWGPDDYERQMKRSRMLRAYGIEKLIQCNHEIAWRDGGESFTLRLRAAPKKGGDEALRRYVAHQRSLGWISGLYTNYTDLAPVNAHWDPDLVQRDSAGEWRSAWPRCWALKPLRAVELAAVLAPQIAAKYGSNSSYTDVHTAVPPWYYCDMDARLPGAGAYAQTFYAYGELLRNDSRAYGGPIFSEGTYHWMYAGLADGNYGHTYNSRNVSTDPLLPVFNLYQIHTKECCIGVSWTAHFCDTMPNWRAPENIDRAIDRFLLHTLAYGHIGWLVEEDHGIQRACRSYYLLQQVQARYGLQAPRRIAYWDGMRLRTVSEAVDLDLPRTRRQMLVEYPGGLTLWVNDHPTETWTVTVGSQRVTLPPAGWAARQPQRTVEGRAPYATPLLALSALDGPGRRDYVRCADYTYLDGRGVWHNAPECATAGALVIRPAGPNRLRITRIAGDEAFLVRRPYGVTGAVARCEAFDVEGARLPAPLLRDGGRETWVTPPAGAVRLEMTFDGKREWTASAADAEVPPGGATRLSATAPGASWTAEGADVRDGRLVAPSDAQPGGMVTATAAIGGASRQVAARVVAPVRWRWTSTEGRAESVVRVEPVWRLAGLPPASLRLRMEASAGWECAPSVVEARHEAPPVAIALRLSSTAPAGAEGTLRVVAEGLHAAAPLVLTLRRVERQPVLADPLGQAFTWGVRFRGRPEEPNVPGSGAVCHVQASMAVGGVARAGLFMHPPCIGGVGYTWALTAPFDVPPDGAALTAQVGCMDGGDVSDGVTFIVEAVDERGARREVARVHGVQREWRPLRADLSTFAGRRVRLRLIADVGPADNPTTDWACWGEPRIVAPAPFTVTHVTAQ
ncbi:MAG TPA: hypothetical protein VLH79_02880 [Chthonomonadales bacterium]|nr:hypothetical protein [Chthonomonadales bacterium]